MSVDLSSLKSVHRWGYPARVAAVHLGNFVSQKRADVVAIPQNVESELLELLDILLGEEIELTEVRAYVEKTAIQIMEMELPKRSGNCQAIFREWKVLLGSFKKMKRGFGKNDLLLARELKLFLEKLAERANEERYESVISDVALP